MSVEKVVGFDGKVDISILNKILQSVDKNVNTVCKYYTTVPNAGDIAPGQIGLFRSGTDTRIYYNSVSGAETVSGYVEPFSGYSGSGISGYSGPSGYSGGFGYSGISGWSGYSGYSSVSGYTGYSGYSGSGVSGYTGTSGFSGYSGFQSPLFVQTADVTVANSNTETTLVGAGTGSVTLPANFFTAGKNVYILATGYYSTINPAGTIRIKIKLGTTIILDTGANSLLNGLTNLYWAIRLVDITCRTTGVSGTVMGQGQVIYSTAHTAATIDDFTPNTSAIVIDTTSTQAVSITVQWGTQNAGNTITCTNLSIF